MKKGYFILFFFLGLFFNMSAQSDYAIDKKGDTIRGHLRKSLFGKIRLETADGKIDLDPDGISLYHKAGDNETFCSRVLPGNSRPVFITRLLTGSINMYSYTIVYNNGRTTYSTTTWYAEKKDIPIDEIKAGGLRGGKNDRKDFFRSLIADNPEVVKRFDDDSKLKLGFLKELIEEYNTKADN